MVLMYWWAGQLVWFLDPSCMGGVRKAFLAPPMQEGSGNQTIPVTDTAQEAKVEKNTTV